MKFNRSLKITVVLTIILIPTFSLTSLIFQVPIYLAPVYLIYAISAVLESELPNASMLAHSEPQFLGFDKKLATYHPLGRAPDTHPTSNLGHKLTTPYHSGDPSSDQFFDMGGRSFIHIVPSEQIINVTLGSTVEVPLNVTHISSMHPFDRLKLHYVGVMTHFVPRDAPQVTDQQVLESLVNTGKEPYELDLNSTITAVIPSEITVPAGKSTTVILKMTIPKDWPSYFTQNGMIPYDIRFTDSEQHNYTDVLIPDTAFAIRITG